MTDFYKLRMCFRITDVDRKLLIPFVGNHRQWLIKLSSYFLNNRRQRITEVTILTQAEAISLHVYRAPIELVVVIISNEVRALFFAKKIFKPCEARGV